MKPAPFRKLRRETRLILLPVMTAMIETLFSPNLSYLDLMFKFLTNRNAKLNYRQ